MLQDGEPEGVSCASALTFGPKAKTVAELPNVVRFSLRAADFVAHF